MRKDKENAIQMRRMGKSYGEIREVLKIPKSTLSEWFKDEAWSGEIAKRLGEEVVRQSTARIVELDRIRGEHLHGLYEEARNEAAGELERLKYNPLFIAGVMLYWGEGSKGGSSVQFANSDPTMIRFYVSFLRYACGIPLERIKARLILYPDHEEKGTRAYWERFSGIPWEQFTKSTVIQGRHKMRRLTWGVCTVSVSSTYFKEKMGVWLKALPEQLMNREYYENIRPFKEEI
jgi:hypothetical protein